MLYTDTSLDLPHGLFPSGFPTNNLYTFLCSPIRATYLEKGTIHAASESTADVSRSKSDSSHWQLVTVNVSSKLMVWGPQSVYIGQRLGSRCTVREGLRPSPGLFAFEMGLQTPEQRTYM
jgi:hypothetical protein